MEKRLLKERKKDFFHCSVDQKRQVWLFVALLKPFNLIALEICSSNVHHCFRTKSRQKQYQTIQTADGLEIRGRSHPKWKRRVSKRWRRERTIRMHSPALLEYVQQQRSNKTKQTKNRFTNSQHEIKQLSSEMKLTRKKSRSWLRNWKQPYRFLTKRSRRWLSLFAQLPNQARFFISQDLLISSLCPYTKKWLELDHWRVEESFVSVSQFQVFSLLSFHLFLLFYMSSCAFLSTFSFCSFSSSPFFFFPCLLLRVLVLKSNDRDRIVPDSSLSYSSCCLHKWFVCSLHVIWRPWYQQHERIWFFHVDTNSLSSFRWRMHWR